VARDEKGYSQEALAYDAGVDSRYLSKIETSTTSVGLDIVERLADVLGVKPAELLRRPRGETGEMTKARPL
jgi:transcriptional regulator with XRE-family HTH domain